MAHSITRGTASKGATISRVERRKQDTRARILRAAETLWRDGAVDNVTIADITAAADVGHGSFYLHFKTKFDVLVPIIRERAAQVDQQLATFREVSEDPAEVMCVSGRLMGRMMVSDPLWRWVLEQAAVPAEEIQAAVGGYSQRDFLRGVDSGRFVISDEAAISQFALGGFVNSVLAAINAPEPASNIDLAMELVLRVFGLDQQEAAAIAHQALPDLGVSHANS